MSHAYHEELPGYASEQLLHDGCDECESRSHDLESMLSRLDDAAFRAAAERARLLLAGKLRNASDAEYHILRSIGLVLAREARLKAKEDEDHE